MALGLVLLIFSAPAWSWSSAEPDSSRSFTGATSPLRGGFEATYHVYARSGNGEWQDLGPISEIWFDSHGDGTGTESQLDRDGYAVPPGTAWSMGHRLRAFNATLDTMTLMGGARFNHGETNETTARYFDWSGNLLGSRHSIVNDAAKTEPTRFIEDTRIGRTVLAGGYIGPWSESQTDAVKPILYRTSALAANSAELYAASERTLERGPKLDHHYDAAVTDISVRTPSFRLFGDHVSVPLDEMLSRDKYPRPNSPDGPLGRLIPWTDRDAYYVSDFVSLRLTHGAPIGDHLSTGQDTLWHPDLPRAVPAGEYLEQRTLTGEHIATAMVAVHKISSGTGSIAPDLQIWGPSAPDRFTPTPGAMTLEEWNADEAPLFDGQGMATIRSWTRSALSSLNADDEPWEGQVIGFSAHDGWRRFAAAPDNGRTNPITELADPAPLEQFTFVAATVNATGEAARWQVTATVDDTGALQDASARAACDQADERLPGYCHTKLSPEALSGIRIAPPSNAFAKTIPVTQTQQGIVNITRLSILVTPVGFNEARLKLQSNMETGSGLVRQDDHEWIFNVSSGDLAYAEGSHVDHRVPPPRDTSARVPTSTSVQALEGSSNKVGAAGFGIFAVATTLRLLLTGPGIHLLGSGLALFSRIARDELLDNERRNNLHDHLRADPGANLTEICEALGLALGTAVHHLTSMEKAGLVASIKVSRQRHYFATEATRPRDRLRVAYARHSVARAFLDGTTERGAVTLSEVLAETGTTKANASRVGTKLANAGLVVKERSGRDVRYVTPDNAA